MSIVGILVALVLMCLIWWAIVSILKAFGIGDPIATLVKVVFVVIVVLWVVSTFFGYGPGVRLH